MRKVIFLTGAGVAIGWGSTEPGFAGRVTMGMFDVAGRSLEGWSERERAGAAAAAARGARFSAAALLFTLFAGTGGVEFRDAGRVMLRAAVRIQVAGPYP